MSGEPVNPAAAASSAAPFRFGTVAAMTLLAMGIIGGMVPILQSTLLPQLVKEGRLTLAQLGQVAMAEAAGNLLAISIANARLRFEHLRWIIGAVALIGLAADAATAHLPADAILAVRFVHGLCAGIVLWIWVGFLTRSDNPGRWIAIYVTGQGTLVFALAAWFSADLLPRWGASGAFGVVAGLYAIIGLLVPLIPRRFPPLSEHDSSVMPTPRGWIGLLAVFSQVAAILALWVYIKPLAAQIGLDEATTGNAVSVALASQILAGLVAAAIAGRIRPDILLVVAAAGSMAAILVLYLSHSALPFFVGATVFAFLWMLIPPFHMPYLIEIDPSRRSAVHATTAQLVGVAAGPALASVSLHGGDVMNALLLAEGLYAASIVIILALSRTNRARLATGTPA